MASAELMDYPRWSEPVGGLVARAMSVLWSHLSHEAAEFTEGTLRCETELVSRGVAAPRLIADWVAARQGGCIRVEARDEYGGQAHCESAVAPSSDWRFIALAAQCMATWSAPNLPQYPKSLEIPIRTENGTPYVRGADIPEPA